MKILKDIPGYKAGQIIEGLPIVDSAQKFIERGYAYWGDRLVLDGFAEEVKDEIRMYEIRAASYPVRNARVGDSFTHEELEWIDAFRVVKTAIEKLNNGWVVQWNNIQFNIPYGYLIRYIHNLGSFEAHPFNMPTQGSILPYMKDLGTANKVIELCKSELEILFGVK